jgi:hypothetical protein
MPQSDSIHASQSPTIPTPELTDYNFWLHSLEPLQHADWHDLTKGMTNEQRKDRWKGMLKTGKATIVEGFGLILAQPLAKAGDFGPTDIFVCQKWAKHHRRTLAYIPQAGFCSVVSIIREPQASK